MVFISGTDFRSTVFGTAGAVLPCAALEAPKPELARLAGAGLLTTQYLQP